MKGFTLIELIVVLVIVGIIAGVTVPRYTTSFDSIKFRESMSDIVFFLREARIKAMSGDEQYAVTVNLHKGSFVNGEKKVLLLPREIEMFTDSFESRDDQTKIFTFYSNGTALEGKLGFVSGKMTAVLHVDYLGGLAYYKLDEEMEPIVRYARSDEPFKSEDTEKNIDKSKDFDTVKNTLVGGNGDSENDEENKDDVDDDVDSFDEGTDGE